MQRAKAETKVRVPVGLRTLDDLEAQTTGAVIERRLEIRGMKGSKSGFLDLPGLLAAALPVVLEDE